MSLHQLNQTYNHNNNVTSRKRAAEHKTSSNLTKDEQKELCRLFDEHKRLCIAMAVAQLHVTSPPEHRSWQKKLSGVGCFIKDNARRSYYIQMYSVDGGSGTRFVWEQELYTDFKYKIERPFFHVFECDNCHSGLNFAFDNEAEYFRKSVHDKLASKEQRKERRKAQQITPYHHNFSSNLHSNSLANGAPMSLSASTPNLPITGKKSKKKEKKKLTKADIGLPKNFQHIQHVGWDPNTGFDIGEVEPELKEFFNKAGVSQDQLKDEHTRKFIYDFISQHGGVEAAIREATSPSVVPPPPVPTRQPPTPSMGRSPAPVPPTRHPAPPPPPPPPPLESGPPPPPNRTPHRKNSLPPPLPKNPPIHSSPGVAPPPPPSRGPNVGVSPRKASGAPPPPTGAAPPPPPPPPPMTDGAPPPPPPMNGFLSPPPADIPASTSSTSLPEMSDGRSALLDQIRKGTQLKHVDLEKRSSISTDSRGQLMDEIRHGVDLKPVGEVNHSSSHPAEPSGMAGALARALANRHVFMQSSDSSDSNSDDEEEDDDDEWDD